MRISEVLKFQGSPCTKDCSGHIAGYKWSTANKGAVTNTPSKSFDAGTTIASNQSKAGSDASPKVRDQRGKFASRTGTIPSRGPTTTP